MTRVHGTGMSANRGPVIQDTATDQPTNTTTNAQVVQGPSEHPPANDAITRGRRQESHMQEQSVRISLENRLGSPHRNQNINTATSGQTNRSQVTSPAGIPYDSSARVASNLPIFQQGPNGPEIDRNHVVNMFSQYDQNRRNFDPNQCGPTVAISAAIMNGGQQGLSEFSRSLRNQLPRQEQHQLEQIQRRIDNGSATYGDLSRLNNFAFQIYGIPDGTSQMSTSHRDMHTMLQRGGLAADGAPGNIQSFRPGQSWPFLMDTNHDGRPNHWVLAGRNQDGQLYIYDPLPTRRGQLHIQGAEGSGFEAYRQAIEQQQNNADQLSRSSASRGIRNAGPRPGWAPDRPSPFE